MRDDEQQDETIAVSRALIEDTIRFLNQTADGGEGMDLRDQLRNELAYADFIDGVRQKPPPGGMVVTSFSSTDTDPDEIPSEKQVRLVVGHRPGRFFRANKLVLPHESIGVAHDDAEDLWNRLIGTINWPVILMKRARNMIHGFVEIKDNGVNMEKNGNTFVPGDQVRKANTGKIASSHGVGEVKPETSEGRVKVAWEDGTESWELTEDLIRG